MTAPLVNITQTQRAAAAPPTAPQPAATAAPVDSYDADHFAPIFAVEDRHFWFRARLLLLLTVIRRLVAGKPAGYRVLEIGCGSGNVLAGLAKVCRRGQVIGLDAFAEGLRFARRRTAAPLVQGDALQPPFARRFDIVGLFDVIEHLEDDRGFLRSARELLAPDGALVITVPANAWLWSAFDVASRHQRRYSRADLEATLQESGYTVEYCSPFFAALVPLMLLGRRVGELATRLGVARGDSVAREMRVVLGLNRLLFGLLMLERRVIGRVRLVFGSSLLAIARPRSPDQH